MSDANSLKDLGNKAFAAKDWDTAIDYFSKGLEIDPSNHVLWSNRSAAKAGKKDWAAALADAEECVKVKPGWAKGYARKGAALHGSRKYKEAIAAYEEGIKLENSPALQKGLKEVKDALASSEADASGMGLGNMFSDPGLLAKLAASPRTAKYLSDPSFMQTFRAIQQNPRLASNALQDPRMIDVMGVAMGIDISASTRPEGSGSSEDDDLLRDFRTPPSSFRSPPPPPAASSSKPPPASAPAPAPQEDVEMEDDEEAKTKKEAEAEKKIGAEAYKKRDFDTAIQHFEKAWDTWPKDITYLTNAGAAYFEKGDYDKAIEICEKAAEEGRSMRADYKLVAKAYGRIGTSYQRKNDVDLALKYFNKSLTEHRTPDVLNKLKEVEKAKAEAERLAYVDPEKSAAAREEGNVKFKGGDYAGSVKDYTESIKRDPSDARGFNNRAAAYMKLMAFPDALKDAEKAIEVDAKFIKAYIRKANILFSMREYTRALEALQAGTEHDESGQHAKEIQQTEYKIQQALFTQRGTESSEETLARAMRDPEVAQIMSDPVMQQILQQAQEDPKALQDHLKNTTIRQKIQKLMNAGIIKTR